jgi:hypothetical protein
MPSDGLPHTSTAPLVVHVLDRAARLGYPAVALPGGVVGPGEGAWGAWVATADRRQLVEAIGVLTVRVHREGKA